MDNTSLVLIRIEHRPSGVLLLRPPFLESQLRSYIRRQKVHTLHWTKQIQHPFECLEPHAIGSLHDLLQPFNNLLHCHFANSIRRTIGPCAARDFGQLHHLAVRHGHLLPLHLPLHLLLLHLYPHLQLLYLLILLLRQHQNVPVFQILHLPEHRGRLPPRQPKLSMLQRVQPGRRKENQNVSMCSSPFGSVV
ncbi:hypothetical protein V8G54_033825 [Vigna mungo]|uniref:Uncharacterized protein n=1 Tax=Vigna mungo TaxID=3915 RepID=A0AAQ3RJ54_VIGMU